MPAKKQAARKAPSDTVKKKPAAITRSKVPDPVQSPFDEAMETVRDDETRVTLERARELSRLASHQFELGHAYKRRNQVIAAGNLALSVLLVSLLLTMSVNK